MKSNLFSLPFSPSDRLLFVINTIKEEIVARVEDCSPRPTNMTDTLEHLMQQTLGENPLGLDGHKSHHLLLNDTSLTRRHIYQCQKSLFCAFHAIHLPFLLVSAVAPPVAGQTSDFVNKILDNTGRGDPTGGLVGLRVPTSKI